MSIRGAVREQLRDERRNRWLALLLVVGCGLLAAMVGLPRARSLLLGLGALSAADLRLLLLWSGGALLLLIPIAGIVSLVSQFAFWEGWLEGLPQADALFSHDAQLGQDAQPVDLKADASRHSPHAISPKAIVVYLDGIHQQELDHPPRVGAFLSELQDCLGPQLLLLRGLETYTVMPVALAEDTGGSWFWRRLFALQEQHPSPLVQLLAAVLVQANNVIKVGISSDRRYGPIRHYELALKIGLRLGELGFQPGGATQLVLLGYSGGGEMAFGVADYLSRLCRVPVHIRTFCGVFSAAHPLDRVASIAMVVGDRDPVAAFGSIAYPGRSPLLPLSCWRRAMAAGRVQTLPVQGMTHNGSRGPFSDTYRSAVVQALVQSLVELRPLEAQSPSP